MPSCANLWLINDVDKTLEPSFEYPTDENQNCVFSFSIDDLEEFDEVLSEYADYVTNFISDMNKVFEFGDDDIVRNPIISKILKKYEENRD